MTAVGTQGGDQTTGFDIRREREKSRMFGISLAQPGGVVTSHAFQTARSETCPSSLPWMHDRYAAKGPQKCHASMGELEKQQASW